MVNEQQNKMERLASNGESFYIQKHPLKKNKTAFKKGNLLPGKSKELVGNWNQRFLDAKVLISIVYSEREENKRGF